MNTLEEQLAWLKAYSSETTRLGVEAVNIGREMVGMMNTVIQYGGWHEFQTKYPEQYREFEPIWRKVCFRHSELSGILEKRL